MRRLEEKKIRVSAVGSPIGKIGIGDDFEPHLEKLAHVMRLAKIWDTPYNPLLQLFYSRGREAGELPGRGVPENGPDGGACGQGESDPAP